MYNEVAHKPRAHKPRAHLINLKLIFPGTLRLIGRSWRVDDRVEIYYRGT